VRDQYDDGGTLERPGLKQLLADIEEGLIDVVVVYKIDRLSRALMDFSTLVEVFDRNGVTFVSVTQSFNTTTSMGRLTLNILLSFAQFEREVTAERIRDKVAASRKKGMWMAETYLRGRGITCELPRTLRFAPNCWHGATAQRHPALIAAVQGSGAAAVHRTYLRPDGSGKAAIAPDKAMLGAVAGGAVRLTQGQGPLVVAEGVETALSLASGLLRYPATIWAALSTSGIRGLHLPPQPGRLTIAPDGDTAGREAANALAERAHALGWQVSLLPAPDGRDWNDIVQGRAAA